MAHRKLTLAEQLKGVRAALRSRRTPPQLRDGLRQRAQELEKILGGKPASTGVEDQGSGKRFGFNELFQSKLFQRRTGE